MLNNKNNIVTNLRRLGLTADEAVIYIALLEKPMSHLELARETKINRTKIYRLADNLKEKSLITIKQRDDGKFLSATTPTNLEVALDNQEHLLDLKKRVLENTLPVLSSLFNSPITSKDFFTVNTYQGVSGLKQMLWNELKTEGEICIFSHDTLDSFAGRTWAEKYRTRLASAGIPHRSLENTESKHVLDFTQAEGYRDIYKARLLPREVFDIKQELTIHDGTVSIYNWTGGEDALRVGVEIKNQDFANFMKSIFENYWKIAQ
jgi:sugar-specific transcriptional regulator TrmB